LATGCPKLSTLVFRNSYRSWVREVKLLLRESHPQIKIVDSHEI